MAVIRNGRSVGVLMNGVNRTASIVNGINRLESIGGGTSGGTTTSNFRFEDAGVAFSINNEGIVTLTVRRGTISSATFNNGDNLGIVTTARVRDNNVVVNVPTGFGNSGSTVSGTVRATHPAGARPTVVTLEANVSGSSATLRGNISNEGTTRVTRSGFYLAEGVQSEANLVGFGQFFTDGQRIGIIEEDTGTLRAGRTYSYVAIAENSVGIGTGGVRLFQTGRDNLAFNDSIQSVTVNNAGRVTVITDGRTRVLRIGQANPPNTDVSAVGNAYSADLFEPVTTNTQREVFILLQVTDSSSANNGARLPVGSRIVLQQVTAPPVLTVRIVGPDVLNIDDLAQWEAIASTTGNDRINYRWTTFDALGTQAGQVNLIGNTLQTVTARGIEGGAIGLRVTVTSGSLTETAEQTIFVIGSGGRDNQLL